ESRMTLGGASDAAELPASPGHAFLRVGTDALQRFKAAYVSGPHHRAIPAPAGPEAAHRILDFTTVHAPSPAAPTAGPSQPVPPVPSESLADVIVGRLAGQGPAAHRVWLPPLGQPSSVAELRGGPGPPPGRGAAAASQSLWGSLRIPIGIIDKPYEQRRDVAMLDLAGAAGHLAIVGNPQSGKSTAVRTVVTALALTHT